MTGNQMDNALRQKIALLENELQAAESALKFQQTRIEGLRTNFSTLRNQLVKPQNTPISSSTADDFHEPSVIPADSTPEVFADSECLEFSNELPGDPDALITLFKDLNVMSETERQEKLKHLGEAVRQCEHIMNTELARNQQLEEERRQKEKLRGVLEMAGAVCHELSQPVMAISGYCELLMDEVKREDNIYDTIVLLKEQSDRIGKLTHRIARITKYKTKHYFRDHHIIDINESSSFA